MYIILLLKKVIFMYVLYFQEIYKYIKEMLIFLIANNNKKKNLTYILLMKIRFPIMIVYYLIMIVYYIYNIT